MAAPSPLSFEFWDTEAQRAWNELSPLMLRILFNGAQSGAAAMPAGMDVLVNWDWFNDAAIRFLDTWRGGTFAEMNNYTRTRTIKTISEWIQSGDALPVLEERLAPLFGSSRARRIAATEVTRAYGEGNVLAWQSSGVVSGKRWMTARDERVCPICGPLHNKVVSLSGGWTMDAGGQIVEGFGLTSPPAHVNCRCWLQPFVEPDAIRAERRRRLGLG